jgi:hypothetical protein
MANYSQPYGAPFPFPPQQMQHPADGPHAGPDGQHAPPSFPMPGLHQQHAPAPSINYNHNHHHHNHNQAAYGHNMQHPAYPPQPQGMSMTLGALRKTDSNPDAQLRGRLLIRTPSSLSCRRPA